MKVFVNKTGLLGGLVWHLQKEGDEVVQTEAEAEVVIRDPMEIPGVSPEDHSALADHGQGVEGSFFLTKVFDGRRFLEQTMIGVPLIGLMNGGQSVQQPTGCVIGYCEVRDLSWYPGQFDRLLEPLSQIDYTGPVSVSVGDGKHTCILGVPSFGLYSILQGLVQKISEFHSEPKPFQESWVCSLVLSRYPWPVFENHEQTSFSIEPNMEKSLWLWPWVNRFKNGLSTTRTFLGVSTAWSTFRLGSACSRAIDTLEHIHLPEKQYRTDPKRTVLAVLEPLLKRGTIRLSDRCVI